MNNKIIDAEIDARTDPKGGKKPVTQEKNDLLLHTSLGLT